MEEGMAGIFRVHDCRIRFACVSTLDEGTYSPLRTTPTAGDVPVQLKVDFSGSFAKGVGVAWPK